MALQIAISLKFGIIGFLCLIVHPAHRMLERRILILFLVILLIGAVSAFISPEFRSFAAKVLPIPQPETFTELYFTNHLRLPTKVSSGTKQEFSFTIHNLEGKDVRYLYQVVLLEGGENKLLDTKEVSVPKGEFKNINESFVASVPSDKTRVLVTLPFKEQFIDYKFNVQ